MNIATDDTGNKQQEEAEALKDKVADAAELERGMGKEPSFFYSYSSIFFNRKSDPTPLLEWSSLKAVSRLEGNV